MMSRRSSRRLTITGSSVFSASTPVVQDTVKENSITGSPQWVSAEEAFIFKTPKFNTTLTRRTTMTRQNIFHEVPEESIAEDAEPKDEGFKIPMFIPISPPGVKTRSRRSSMFLGKQTNQSNFNGNNNNNNIAHKRLPVKVNNVIDAKKKPVDTAVKKTRKSIAIARPKEIVKSDLKEENVTSKTTQSLRKPGHKRTVDDVESKFTAVEKLSTNVDDREVKNDRKRVRRSGIQLLEAEPLGNSEVITDRKNVRRSGVESLKSLNSDLSGRGTTFVQEIETPRSRVQISKVSQVLVESKTVELQSNIKGRTPKIKSSQDSSTILLKTEDVSEVKISSKDNVAAKQIFSPPKDLISFTPIVATASLPRRRVATPKEIVSSTPLVSSTSLSKGKIATPKDLISFTPIVASASLLKGKLATPISFTSIAGPSSRSRGRAATPKEPEPLSPVVKSASRATGLKRFTARTDDSDEIDTVVKKMFSPKTFYSATDLNHKHKFTSPNTRKALSSPARAAIMKKAAAVELKSITQTPGREPLETSFAQKTPSRAAPKARKILGVATPSKVNIMNDENEITTDRKGRNVETVPTSDETETSTSLVEENMSFGAEDENNLTLSHTSHSQWCTIL